MNNKLSRIIKYDLVCGFKYNFKKYIIATIIIIMCCSLFVVFSDNIKFEQGADARTYMDYLIYFFKGVPEADFIIGYVGIPVVFLAIQIVIASMVGYYPFDDIYGYGKQVFIRVEKKSNWWRSKFVWIFTTVVAFYILLYGTIFIFCLMSGGEISLSYHPELVAYMDQVFIGFVAESDIYLYVFLVPVIYSLTISVVQVAVSMVTGPIISFLMVMIYHISGVLLLNKALLTSYTMIVRDKMVNGSFIEPAMGIIYMYIPLIISIVVGFVIIKRKEVFEK